MFAGDVTVGLQIGGMQAFTRGWGAALAVVANFSRQALGALTDLGRQAIGAGDDIQKLSQRIGWSTEALSEMRAVLDLNDASMSDLQAGTRNLARTLNDASRGSARAAAALEDLGLSVDRLQKIRPEERFRAVATAISQVDDTMTRTALASEVFGRSADRLLPTINALSRGAGGLAERINNIYTTEQAETFAEFNDMSSLLRQSLEGVGRVVAAQVLPALNPLIAATATLVGEFSRWLEGSELIGQAAGFVSQAWHLTWGNMDSIARGIAHVFRGLIVAAEEWRHGMVGRFLSAKESVLATLDRMVRGIVGMFPEGMAGDMMMRAVGLDPMVWRKAAEQTKDAAERAVMDVTAHALSREAAIEAAEELVSTLEGLTVGSLETIGDMVLTSTNMISEFIRTSHEEFKGLMGSAVVAVDELGEKGQETAQQLSRSFTQYSGVASGALAQLVTQSGRSAGEIVGNMMKALGEMSAREGMQHILAGTAMLFAPGMRGAGRQRIASGAKLAAFGSMLASMGGGSGGGGGGGEAVDVPSMDDRTGPGFDMRDSERDRVQIVVQGDMFDSRETFVRLAEIVRDYSDADIEIARA